MEALNEEFDDNPVSPIDLSIFKEQIELNLLNIIDLIPKQEKSLVIEKSLISKLNFIIKMDPLKQRQVNEKISILNTSPPIVKTPILLYIIPPKKEIVEIIQTHMEDNINKTSININIIQKKEKKDKKDKKDKKEPEKEKEKEEEIKKEFHIIFIPKITNDCNNYIKNSNFASSYHVYNFNMDIFPLDYDLMSLEDYTSFYDLYVEQNLNCISVLARSIIKYESIFGKIKYKYYKGSLAEKLNKALLREEEISTDIDKFNYPGTFACFIFDRAVDMVTPFCTNFVYEGLLDDYFGINFNSIKVDPKILDKESPNDFMKLDLSKNEKFYYQIKDFNFNKIKTYLPNRLKEQTKALEESKSKKMDLEKIQESLLKIKLIKEERPSLSNQINLADYIAKKQKIPKARLYLNYEQMLLIGDNSPTFYEFIEDELAKKSDEYNILRMLCLESLIHGGIKNKLYEQIKKDIINIYGFQEIFLLHNLEKMNILKNFESSSNYYNELNKKLKLINESVDINKETDASYSYNGYCPIIIRLIEKAFSKGWNNIKDILTKLPGEFQYPEDENQIIDNESKDKKFILLVFIGGLTYGELGAIRCLNKIMEDKKFIILTTSMINNNKIFNSLRQGKYKYISGDENYINNNTDSNIFQLKNEQRLTFKSFFEQQSI